MILKFLAVCDESVRCGRGSCVLRVAGEQRLTETATQSAPPRLVHEHGARCRTWPAWPCSTLEVQSAISFAAGRQLAGCSSKGLPFPAPPARRVAVREPRAEPRRRDAQTNRSTSGGCPAWRHSGGTWHGQVPARRGGTASHARRSGGGGRPHAGRAMSDAPVRCGCALSLWRHGLAAGHRGAMRRNDVRSPGF